MPSAPSGDIGLYCIALQILVYNQPPHHATFYSCAQNLASTGSHLIAFHPPSCQWATSGQMWALVMMALTGNQRIGANTTFPGFLSVFFYPHAIQLGLYQWTVFVDAMWFLVFLSHAKQLVVWRIWKCYCELTAYRCTSLWWTLRQGATQTIKRGFIGDIREPRWCSD